MIQDPCHLLKFLNRLTYFDKLKIPIVKSFLFNAFLNRYDNLDLSSAIDITDFQCNKEKNSVLLIGNATSKNIYSSIIDSFDGDVIRFNRFETGDDYGLGKKVTRWALSRNLLFDKAFYGSTLDSLIEQNAKNSFGDIDIFLATYPICKETFNDNVSVLDITKSFNIYKKMYELYVRLNGLIFPYDDVYVKENGAFKPSTGLLLIIDSILMYEDVKIINFDSFRSKHYWKENSKAKAIKYTSSNNVIGNHQPVLELSIIKTLEKMKLISRLI
jgi:hypothetical protein